MTRRPTAGANLTAPALPWITAILVLTAVIFGPEGSEQRIYDPGRDFVRRLHETVGLTVLGLTIQNR